MIWRRKTRTLRKLKKFKAFSVVGYAGILNFIFSVHLSGKCNLKYNVLASGKGMNVHNHRETTHLSAFETARAK